MKALVIGATGAVGRDLVDRLLKDDRFDEVEVFVRRPLGIGQVKTISGAAAGEKLADDGLQDKQIEDGLGKIDDGGQRGRQDGNGEELADSRQDGDGGELADSRQDGDGEELADSRQDGDGGELADSRQDGDGEELADGSQDGDGEELADSRQQVELDGDGQYLADVREQVKLADSRLQSKLVENVVDFERPEEWHGMLRGDVLFSCLGTTIRTAGSQKAQWRVDYDYQYEAAKSAARNGVPTYVLVSSMGADPKSKVFYTRMKGQLDEAVKQLPFRRVCILRPPSLVRKGSDRFGEKAGVAVLRCLNAVGLMRDLRPMPTEEVAAAMVRLSIGHADGVRIVTKQEILTAD